MNVKRIVWTTAALGAALWSAQGDARASHLDKGLIGHAGKVIDALEKEKVKNVGVLPFKVKKGTRQALYAGAPLGVNMPERLENALIMAMNPGPKAELNVIRDAAGVASRANVGSFLNSKSSFGKLFSTSYPLAWGQERVKPDGFLTGVVTNDGDRSKVHVAIQLIKPGTFGQAPKEIHRFTVAADRQTLGDLGYNFSLSRSVLKRGAVRRDQVDQAIQQQVKQEDQQGQKKPQSQLVTTQHTPDNIAGFSYELKYNGEKQTLTPLQGSQGASQPEWTAPPVMQGTKIEMVLTRLDGSQDDMGVLLLVNGRSTWADESGDPELNMRRWIRTPKHKDVPDIFLGRYFDVQGKNLLAWKALSAEESVAKADELGNRAGWIDVYVFANGGGKPQPPQTQDEKEMFVTTRALPKAKPATFAVARSTLMRLNNVKMKQAKGAGGSLITRRDGGGLIDYEIEPQDGGIIGTKEFPNPVLMGKLAIRYWEGPVKQGKIIESQGTQQQPGKSKDQTKKD